MSTKKPVTPSRECPPWISGSAMMGLDLAALERDSNLAFNGDTAGENGEVMKKRRA